MPRLYSDIKANSLLRQMENWFVVISPLADQYPREVLHFYNDSVVIGACYADDLDVFASHTELDLDGNCHATMAVSDDTKLYSQEEAEGIVQCMDADQQLLSYAR